MKDFYMNPEHKLIQEALEGSDRSFEQLVSPLKQIIFRRALKATRDCDEAEDITQEVIIRAFTKLHTFRKESKFSTWLFMVTSNCIRMHLRSKRRRKYVPMEENILEVEEVFAESVKSVLPDESAAYKQLIFALDRHIDLLPKKYREVLELWARDGFDLREIQSYTGMSIPKIKTRIHRARKKLRAGVNSEFGENRLIAA